MADALTGVTTAEQRQGTADATVNERTPQSNLPEKSVTTYVALGANLGEPRQMLRWAVQQLRALGAVTGVSRLYRTAPVGGPVGQPNYLNAVVELQTNFQPLPLLEALHAIEAEAGRVREVRWGARTLDLDLIVYDAGINSTGDGTEINSMRVIDTPRLTLPHPRAWERVFVLAPLSDLAPLLKHPITGVTVQDSLSRLWDVQTVPVVESDWV